MTATATPKLTPTFNDVGRDPSYNPHFPPTLVPMEKPVAEEAGKSPAAEPEPLQIALIGTAPSSRGLAPYHDPKIKIWACSAGNMGQIPRVDAWFEIHANLLWPENASFGAPYVEWLKKQTFPIYMQDQKLVPNAIPFPRQELIEEFGPYFFTSSFAWMLAMAIKAGAKKILLYGIDMASRDEYILQRPGAFYFFMEAKRRGIEVIAPYESDIMQPPALYGFSDSTPFGRKIASREKELKDRLGPMRNQRDQLTQNITYLEGALEDVDYFKSIWSGVDKPVSP